MSQTRMNKKFCPGMGMMVAYITFRGSEFRLLVQAISLPEDFTW